MKNWVLFPQQAELSQAFAKELGVTSLTAQVLINRGIGDVKEADAFLHPRLAHLRDPLEIPNIVSAAKRVLLAKERGEKVLVYGDYDVDGVTGTAILLHTLRFFGLDASYYIPNRYGEGYSLSLDSVRRIADSGVKLILTVDCGIGSYTEIEEANSLGVDVIVTDHHNLPQQLPRAYALVNPKMILGEHPSKYLSGAGVAFKFVWALLKVADIKDVVFLSSLLDLVALGTFSDVVPLTCENRVLAVNGLKNINQHNRLGLKHLAEASSIRGVISANQIYFMLAPRLNAAGRLEHASKSVELLLCEDAEVAQSMAKELNKINSRRRDIGGDIKESVFAELSDKYITENKLVLLSGENWHPGVIGIVASQIVDRFCRPAVLVGINEGIGRGSARSIDGFNIYELLDSCRDLFLDFGGHEGAAGFEIKMENIPELRRRLREKIDNTISFDDLKAKVIIDAELRPSQITMTLVKELEVLAPHGEGNSLPIFMSGQLSLYDLRKVGKTGKHLKAKFTDGNVTLDTIGFGMGDIAEKLSYEGKYDIAYRLEANEWGGFEVAQLSLVDIRRVAT